MLAYTSTTSSAMLTAVTIPLLALVGWIIYLVCVALYWYFRDPKGLRRYPTINAVAGITNLGFMWEAYIGFRSGKLAKLHQKHPVIRTGPNTLSFGDPCAIKPIYGHNTKCIKGQFYETLAGSHFHLADVVNKQEHSRKRKLLSNAYAIKNLQNWEHKVADKTIRFIRACDKHCTAPLISLGALPKPEDLSFNYRLWANYFTIDAIADIGLSERLEILDTGSDEVTAQSTDGVVYNASYRESLHAAARALSIWVWACDWYQLNSKYLSKIIPSFREMWKLGARFDDIVNHRATKRLVRYQAGEKLNDFFQCLMEDRDGKSQNVEWGEVLAELNIMLNAGSDTTALAMNNVIHWLLKNPKCLERLREEIDSVMKPDDIIASYDQVRYLPYLKACLDESLRITPPITYGLPRRTPPEGLEILGEWIPGDTTVEMSAYVAHRDPKIFPDPELYNPDRWLGEAGKKLQPFFITFSTGARGCIGRNISYLEQTVLLASVVHRYEMALPSPDWVQDRWECLNLMAGPMPLKVWRRTEKN